MPLDNPPRRSSIGSESTLASYWEPQAPPSLKPGVTACLRHCACWHAILWFAVFPLLLGTTLFAKPWTHEPGNSLREEIHAQVVSSLGDGQNWNEVKDQFREHKERRRFGVHEMRKNGMLVIGNQQGVKLLAEDGIEQKERIPAGSQTKFLTALLIYRIMYLRGDNTTVRLTPETKISSLISTWPETGHGGMVELRHLLSHTTGMIADFFNPGCATDLDVHGDDTEEMKWERCLTELALSEFRYPPGTYFNYGPWHLHIAVAAVMRALNLPLTRATWKDLMQTYVYQPSGISEAPDFTGDDSALPDVNYGMEVSAQQWQKILQALMYGGVVAESSTSPGTEPLLDTTYADYFFADHNGEVEKYPGDTDGEDVGFGKLLREQRARQHLVGKWHYAQGHWIVCDALASQKARDHYNAWKQLTWYEQNQACGYTIYRYRSDPRIAPVDVRRRATEVHHSGNEHGAFIWMSLDSQTNQPYYGIFMMNYNWWAMFFGGVCGLMFFSLLCCCMSCCVGAMVLKNKKKDDDLFGPLKE